MSIACLLNKVLGFTDAIVIAASNAVHTVLATVDITEITGGDQAGGMLENVVTGVKTTGQDAYTLLMVIGMFGGVLCFIVAGIAYAISGKGVQKQESKGWLITILVAVALISCATFIVGLVQTIGTNMGETIDVEGPVTPGPTTTP